MEGVHVLEGLGFWLMDYCDLGWWRPWIRPFTVLFALRTVPAWEGFITLHRKVSFIAVSSFFLPLKLYLDSSPLASRTPVSTLSVSPLLPLGTLIAGRLDHGLVSVQEQEAVGELD
jgi:hypothetical protein